MSKKIKVGNVVLCEYLVPGIGNKHTLINVYSGDVVVETLPATLRFALYAEYHTITDDAFDLLIEMNIDGALISKLRASIDASRKGQVGILAIPGMEIVFDRDVTFEIKVTPGGERSMSVLKKKIYRGLVVTAPTA